MPTQTPAAAPENAAKTYESVIVQADRFEKGGFWNLNVTGYVTNDGPDEPVSIECDPNCLSYDNYPAGDEASVLDELRMIAALHTADAGTVTVMVEGEEKDCLRGGR